MAALLQVPGAELILVDEGDALTDGLRAGTSKPLQEGVLGFDVSPSDTSPAAHSIKETIQF